MERPSDRRQRGRVVHAVDTVDLGHRGRVRVLQLVRVRRDSALGVHDRVEDRDPGQAGLRSRAGTDEKDSSRAGAFYTLVPIRPRSRGERRSLRTFPGVSLRSSLAFNPRPRRLSTPPDAFELNPDNRLYGTTISPCRRI